MEFVEAVAELPSLVRQVAVLRTEKEHVTRGTQGIEDQEQNILTEQHEHVRLEQIQAFSGIPSPQDMQKLNEHVDAAASPIRAPTRIESFKQVSHVQLSLEFRVHIGLQKGDVISWINKQVEVLHRLVYMTLFFGFYLKLEALIFLVLHYEMITRCRPS